MAVAALGLGGARIAQGKPFEEYLKPAPIVCSPLGSASWGMAGVLPRDLCNGIESAKGAAVPPEFFYWDGQIIRAKDGKYHMFMSTFGPGSVGFQNWSNSDAYHAISDNGVLGQYQRQDYVYTNGGSHKGHNVSAAELLDGTYVVVVSETVPFTIYKATSLDGPWTACPGGELIQSNGIKTNSTVTCAPGGPCNDSHWDSNVSIVARPDGKFEIVQRHGFIAIADSVCGPYKMQKPTWTYPQANLPNVDSIYPKRTSIPGVSNPTYGWEEDPHIWYSAGTYHVIYSGSQDRVGYHLYSSDGITNWKDNGYAWSPRDYQKIFCYEGSTTCNQWYKMERPGVVLQDGHPTHITWAVADVDKDNQIPAGSNHGSKVIVVPFDGVAFDADFGGAAGAGGATGAGGAGGITSTGGRGGSAGGGGRGGASGGGAGGATGATSGSAGRGGVATGGASGGSASGGSASGGTTATGGGEGGMSPTGSGSGGLLGSGGRPGGNSASGGTSSTGGASGTGGASPSESGGSTGSGGSRPPAGNDGSSGCSCALRSIPRDGGLGHGLLLGALAIGAAQRRTRRSRDRRRERDARPD